MCVQGRCAAAWQCFVYEQSITYVIPREPSTGARYCLLTNNNSLKGVPEIIPVFYREFVVPLCVCVCPIDSPSAKVTTCVTPAGNDSSLSYRECCMIQSVVYWVSFPRLFYRCIHTGKSVPTNSFLKTTHSWLLEITHIFIGSETWLKLSITPICIYRISKSSQISSSTVVRSTVHQPLAGNSGSSDMSLSQNL